MDTASFQWSQGGLFWGLGILAVTVIVYRCTRHNQHTPSVLYSDLQEMAGIQKTWRVIWASFPNHLKKIAFALFLIALCNPSLKIPFKQADKNLAENKPKKKGKPQFEQMRIPTEGLALYFVLDQSGSMSRTVQLQLGSRQKQNLTRLDALKFFTSQFIKGNESLGLSGRSDDLMGLVGFARVPKVMVPLTLDYHQVLETLDNFQIVQDAREEGTAIGYAIYKTAHIIAATEHFSKKMTGSDQPAYQIKSTAMVLVTDGFQCPANEDSSHPLRSIGIEDAALFAKEKGIRLYIINIEPGMGYQEHQKEQAVQKRAAELTGGQFFLATDAQALHRIYQAIDQMERASHSSTQKHRVRIEENRSNHQPGQKFFFSPMLILAGLWILFISLFLENTILKRVP